MTTQKQQQPFDPTALFHPIEHAFLSDWLGVERPACARDIDLAADVRPYGYAFEDEDADPGQESDGIIHLQKSEFNRMDLKESIGNAVARLVLTDIQDRLPQWAVSYRSGELEFGRGYEKPRRHTVALLPRFLFMINWADSGPGISWPESYHVGFLPFYNVYVVTGSQDSSDAYGYLDRTVGYFKPDVPLLEGCRQVLVADWERQAGYGQEEWEHFIDPGLVDEYVARDWASEVWGVEEDVEEYEEEDVDEDEEVWL